MPRRADALRTNVNTRPGSGAAAGGASPPACALHVGPAPRTSERRRGPGRRQYGQRDRAELRAGRVHGPGPRRRPGRDRPRARAGPEDARGRGRAQEDDPRGSGRGARPDHVHHRPRGGGPRVRARDRGGVRGDACEAGAVPRPRAVGRRRDDRCDEHLFALRDGAGTGLSTTRAVRRTPLLLPGGDQQAPRGHRGPSDRRRDAPSPDAVLPAAREGADRDRRPRRLLRQPLLRSLPKRGRPDGRGACRLAGHDRGGRSRGVRGDPRAVRADERHRDSDRFPLRDLARRVVRSGVRSRPAARGAVPERQAVAVARVDRRTGEEVGGARPLPRADDRHRDPARGGRRRHGRGGRPRCGSRAPTQVGTVRAALLRRSRRGAWVSSRRTLPVGRASSRCRRSSGREPDGTRHGGPCDASRSSGGGPSRGCSSTVPKC